MYTIILLIFPAFLLGFAMVGAISRRIAEKKDIDDEVSRADMYCFLAIDDVITGEKITIPTRRIA